MKNKLKVFFEKRENLYLVLALFFGLIMAFLNPPFAGVPDEHAHYWKAWSVADGYLKCSGKDEIPKTASKLPDSIKPKKIKGIDDKKIVVAKLRQELFAENSDEKSVIGGANCPATPFGYVSQALGLRVGDFLGFSALADFYFARVVTLVFSVLIFYFAIRIVPFGKNIFLVVGLLPMTVRQFASLSYDGIQISLAALFLAYVLCLASEEKKKINRRNILMLLLLSMVGLNIKLGYFAMAFLIFILPKSKFKNPKEYWIFTSIFVLLNVGTVLAIRSIFVDIATPTWTNPTEQLKFVMHAPFHFLYVVFDSFYGAKGFLPYLEGILFKIGTGDSLEGWLYVLIVLGMIVFIKNAKEEVKLVAWQRWIMFGVFMLNFILVYLALYLGWTEVGADGVSGVQGRYFVAILPLLFFTFYKSKFTFESEWVKKHLKSVFTAFVLVVFFFVFQAIYKQQYQKVNEPKNPVYEEYLMNQQK